VRAATAFRARGGSAAALVGLVHERTATRCVGTVVDPYFICRLGD